MTPRKALLFALGLALAGVAVVVLFVRWKSPETAPAALVATPPVIAPPPASSATRKSAPASAPVAISAPVTAPATPAPKPPPAAEPAASESATATAEIARPPTPEERLKAVVAEMFEGMLPGMGLPQARQDALMTLLEQRQAAIGDAVNAGLQRGLKPPQDLEAIRQLADDVRNNFDRQLRATFGEDVYAQYRAWDNTRTERNTLSDANRLAGDTGLQLSPEQAAFFLKALADTKAPYPPAGIGRVVYGGMNQRARISDQTIAALDAAGLFSANQIKHLQNVQALQQPQAQRPEASAPRPPP